MGFLSNNFELKTNAIFTSFARKSIDSLEGHKIVGSATITGCFFGPRLTVTFFHLFFLAMPTKTVVDSIDDENEKDDEKAHFETSIQLS